jgi:amino-acid N-acetyltransferase
MSATGGPRAASPVDLARLRELLTAEALPDAGLDEAWGAWVVDGAAADQLVGGVAVERHEDSTGRAYLLRSLVVSGDARGSGVGSSLVRAALAAADHDGPSPVGLLTETADDYFPRFGFSQVRRHDLPSALSRSPELSGACPDSARAYLRLPPPGTPSP